MPVALDVALVWFHTFIVVATLYRTVTFARRYRAQPFLDGNAETTPGPSGSGGAVSIIIPARNEAHNLPACLRSALAQRAERLEVILVDDHSTDGTLEVASALASEDARLRVLRSGDLPEGWAGKNHALHQGASVAIGDWLLFIDADVTLAPAALSVALRFVEARGLDFLSLSPGQAAEGFWERLVQPLVFELLVMRFDMREVNDPATDAAAANGQFILVRRSAYLRAGGHAAIREEILEDVRLAERLKRAGRRIHFANTRTLARARMYRGLGEIWEGWRKNLFDLLGSSHRLVWKTALEELLLWVMPAATLTSSLLLSAYNNHAGSAAILSGVAALACVVTGGAYIRWIAKSGPGYALLLPLGKAMLGAMILASWYRRGVQGRIVWKGRSYGA